MARVKEQVSKSGSVFHQFHADAATHTWGEFAGDSGRLQLVDGESTTQADLSVVFYGGTVHQGPKFLRGPRRHDTRLRYTCIVATLFAKRLVEPGLDETLPILVEVGVGHGSVALSNHDGTLWDGH